MPSCSRVKLTSNWELMAASNCQIRNKFKYQLVITANQFAGTIVKSPSLLQHNLIYWLMKNADYQIIVFKIITPVLLFHDLCVRWLKIKTRPACCWPLPIQWKVPSRTSESSIGLSNSTLSDSRGKNNHKRKRNDFFLTEWISLKSK